MADTFSVLLVDDDMDTQSLFQDALDHYGIALKLASDQPSTIKALANYSPDVVVLDIFLQDTDGYKLLNTIRSLPIPVTCPIIATTAYYTTDTMGELQKQGFDGYLLKPLDPESLVEYLQNIVKNST
jgi:two-component system cell cycle response regulator DivK